MELWEIGGSAGQTWTAGSENVGAENTKTGNSGLVQCISGCLSVKSYHSCHTTRDIVCRGQDANLWA